MKQTKKLTALILTVLMLLSAVPITVAASTEEHLTEVPDGYVGIYTKDDLDNIKLDMAGSYILMNDIVFEDEDYEKGGSFYNSGKGWEPIGTKTSPFKGIFDGNGYEIINLYVNNQNEDYKGLFGYANSAFIRNLSLCDVNVYGKDYTGSVVGYIKDGTIEKCFFYGSITGNNNVGGIAGYTYEDVTISLCQTAGNISGLSYVGGIVGYQTVSTESKNYKPANDIISCHNAAHISAVNSVGGICGQLESYYYSTPVDVRKGVSSVENCSNSGTVYANEKNAGGIVGCSTFKGSSGYNTYAKRNIKNCFNCGTISTEKYAGGLIGSGTSVVSYCYSVGTVQAFSNFGGCFGDATDSIISFCYYLEESVTEPSCLSGIAKSNDQMIKQTTFEKWDFENVWTMEGRSDYPYPELKDVPLVLPDDFKPHEHIYTSEITTPATHLTVGVMTYTCSACGDTYTEEIAKTTEHSHEAAVTAPTCKEQGYTTYTCACGDTYVSDYVDATGHSHVGTVTTPATHLTTGVMTYTCSACGDTYTEEIAKTTEHTYEAVVTAPTCTKQGYTTYTCACGDSYVADETAATDHTDADNNGICDNCSVSLNNDSEKPNDSSDFFTKLKNFFKSIIDFFKNLFGIN